MATEMTFVMPGSTPEVDNGSTGLGEESGRYVKGLVTYMVTNRLEVTSMSAIFSITLINKFSVSKDIELAEEYVSVGMDDVLSFFNWLPRNNIVLRVNL
jgi:hypothetical protein